MKTLNDIYNRNFFNDLNEELLVEKLLEPHLQELANMIKTTKKEQQKAVKGSSYGYIPNKYRVKIKDLLYHNLYIELDKITEDDFLKFKAGDKKGTKMVRTQLQSTSPEYHSWFIMFLDQKDRINYLVTPSGLIVCSRDITSQEYDSELNKYKQIKADNAELIDSKFFIKNLEDLCSKWDFMVLNIGERQLAARDKRNKRYDAKKGTINKEDYYKIAQENRERYRKIVQKIKAERATANDLISKDVKDVLDEVMTISLNIMKGGIKYAKLSFEIENLLELCYSKVTYDRGKTYGSDGLLVIYKNYVDYTLDSIQGRSYSFQNPLREVERIKKVIEKLNTKIKTIKDKMKEIDDSTKE